jgi:hypothetical protein
VARSSGSSPTDLRRRIAALDWPALADELGTWGWARTARVLDARACRALARAFDERPRFRSHVDMERHRFGAGEYRYFAAPLPEPVATLRDLFYERLAPVANAWMAALGESTRYPPALSAFTARCAAAGQRKPTPLLLRYEAGGYNRLHQDLYGALAFPLQVAIGLSRPGVDYTGGEILLVEGQARTQSRADAVLLGQGEALVFANAVRPVRSARGWSRATMRHGVSRVLSGHRVVLGLIFHNAA